MEWEAHDECLRWTIFLTQNVNNLMKTLFFNIIRCHLGSGPRRPGVQHAEFWPQCVPPQVTLLWALWPGGRQGETLKMIIIITVITINHWFRKWARVRNVAGCAPGVRITRRWWTSSVAGTAGWAGGHTPTRPAATTSRWVRLWKDHKTFILR